jgi:heme-degrading monooxygenase HmoA
MTIKILIKRKVSEDMAPGLDYLLRQMRSLTVRQKGYVSGETLARVDDKGSSLVISTWQNLDDWKRWFTSPERAELQEQIDIMLGDPTEYEIYENAQH